MFGGLWTGWHWPVSRGLEPQVSELACYWGTGESVPLGNGHCQSPGDTLPCTQFQRLEWLHLGFVDQDEMYPQEMATFHWGNGWSGLHKSRCWFWRYTVWPWEHLVACTSQGHIMQCSIADLLGQDTIPLQTGGKGSVEVFHRQHRQWWALLKAHPKELYDALVMQSTKELTFTCNWSNMACLFLGCGRVEQNVMGIFLPTHFSPRNLNILTTAYDPCPTSLQVSRTPSSSNLLKPLHLLWPSLCLTNTA